MTIAENRCQSWQEILDRWLHAIDTDDSDDGTKSPKDGTKDFGVFLSYDQEVSISARLSIALHDMCLG